MPMNTRLRELTELHLCEGITVKRNMVATCCRVLPQMARATAEAFARGGHLFLFGNGGSAADAQHIAAEFVNRLKRERLPLPAIALTVDTSILTAISNDYSFEAVYAKQLAALARPGDIALGISTSGHSPNVLEALKWSCQNGLVTLGLAGETVTEMDDSCDFILHVPTRVTQIVQECHIAAGHIFCALVEEILFGPVE